MSDSPPGVQFSRPSDGACAPGMIVRPCSGCGVEFAVCRRCFRGQRTCSVVCRRARRRDQLRAARGRFRASPAGKEARRRESARRARRGKVKSVEDSLGDQGIHNPAAGQHGAVERRIEPSPDAQPVPETHHVPSVQVSSDGRRPIHYRCCRCGCVSALRISLQDHLAARLSARDHWLEHRQERRPGPRKRPK